MQDQNDTTRGALLSLLEASLNMNEWIYRALAAYEGDPEPSEIQGKNLQATFCAAIDEATRALR